MEASNRHDGEKKVAGQPEMARLTAKKVWLHGPQERQGGSGRPDNPPQSAWMNLPLAEGC